MQKYINQIMYHNNSLLIKFIFSCTISTPFHLFAVFYWINIYNHVWYKDLWKWSIHGLISQMIPLNVSCHNSSGLNWQKWDEIENSDCLCRQTLGDLQSMFTYKTCMFLFHCSCELFRNYFPLIVWCSVSVLSVLCCFSLVLEEDIFQNTYCLRLS